MKLRTLMRAVAACAVAGGTALGAVAIGASSAGASTDYGQGAYAQVEISANGPNGAFWVWAALYPSSSTNPTSGTISYEETDCIHQGGGPLTDAAANDTSGTATYSISGNILDLNNVAILGGLATATFEVPLPSSQAPYYGHTSGLTVDVMSEVPGGPPLPPSFSYAPGSDSQNQIAP